MRKLSTSLSLLLCGVLGCSQSQSKVLFDGEVVLTNNSQIHRVRAIYTQYEGNLFENSFRKLQVDNQEFLFRKKDNESQGENYFLEQIKVGNKKILDSREYEPHWSEGIYYVFPLQPLLIPRGLIEVALNQIAPRQVHPYSGKNGVFFWERKSKQYLEAIEREIKIIKN